MRFVTWRRAFWGTCSCFLAVVVAHGQEPRGFTGVNRTVVPGVAGDLVSDIVAFTSVTMSTSWAC